MLWKILNNFWCIIYISLHFLTVSDADKLVPEFSYEILILNFYLLKRRFQFYFFQNQFVFPAHCLLWLFWYLFLKLYFSLFHSFFLVVFLTNHGLVLVLAVLYGSQQHTWIRPDFLERWIRKHVDKTSWCSIIYCSWACRWLNYQLETCF